MVVHKFSICFIVVLFGRNAKMDHPNSSTFDHIAIGILLICPNMFYADCLFNNLLFPNGAHFFYIFTMIPPKW